MSKNDKKTGLPGLPETTISSSAAAVRGRPEASSPDAPPPAPDASKKYFFIFWGLIILAAAAAWILAILLPGVSESIIERWLMAALAASLAVFLLVYK